jgi:hypothetical protein
MPEDTQRWQVGEASITSVVEAQTDGIPPALFFPDATPELIAQHASVIPPGEEAPLILGTHFPTAPAGHVVADDGTGTWAFRPAREALV